MPTITLKDGTQLKFAQSVTIAEIAAHIGEGLARAAIAGQINGNLYDLSHAIEKDVELAIVTPTSPEGLEVIRHSCAHLLAQAVKQLYPSAQVTIGPVIENGFYYDFAFERSFTPEDLQAIEKCMQQLAKEDLSVKRIEMSRNDAINFFHGQGEEYKAEIIAAIPEDETLSLYQQGDFTDLCRGPHVPSTGKIKAFKLMKLAGAYWRGDSNNKMLQRIYGTAWEDKKALKAYLHRLEEAEKRDHRKLGKAQDLFHFQDEAPGMVFWHDKGWTIYQEIEQYLRKVLRAHDYQEVHTPQMADRSLWEKSGHWDKFGDEMFTTHSENRDYAIKPMNCPCHVQIFNQDLHSYRDLPLRMAEFGSCHRNEPSGTLHGLMRVRHFTQDDAHIFCTEDQIQFEVAAFIDLLFEVYDNFGFNEVMVKLSTRPEKRVGSDTIWDKAEKMLEVALNDKNIEWELLPGEGAFYGPKLEFSLKDCLDRVWQCGTMQVDFSMPDRLGAHYVAEDGSKQTPVMLHRAIFGSMERFIGILLEENAGKLPVWLCPIQVAVMTITDKQADYAQEIAEKLKKQAIRVNLDLRNEKIGFKIREHTLQRVPYQLVIGDKEMSSQQVAVRTAAGEDRGQMQLDAFCDMIRESIQQRAHD